MTSKPCNQPKDRSKIYTNFAPISLKHANLTIRISLQKLSNYNPVLRDTRFEARNVPLTGGASSITATIKDLTGMTNAVSISVMGITNADGSLNDPVQLQAAPVAGFAPLAVAFQITSNGAPGTLQQMIYDFNGDDIDDLATNSLDGLTHTYETNGQYYPMVTIQTDAGRFSSIGGWNAVTLDTNDQPILIRPYGLTK
jgi:hypothetical protein